MKFVFSIGLLLTVWQFLSLYFGMQLVPGPVVVVRELVKLIQERESWEHILVTLFRGVTGLGVSLFGGLLVGIPCGLNRRIMELVSPLITASQGCPPIIWISLLMVWVGMSSVVPVVVIIISLFPVLFYNIAQGVASLDRGLFCMARLYRVSNLRVVKEILLPGIRPYLLSSFSYSLGVAWKVTATAEFFGSSAGIGSRLYWSYRFLNMPQLFCWALILVIIGFSIELSVIEPLRKKYTLPVSGGGYD